MSESSVQMKESQEETVPYTLWQLVVYFLRLGTVGFGGPVALVGYMFRDLVEKRRWISNQDYKDGLALSQLAPGPLAAQLGFYLGYVHYGVWGATWVGLAFVMPSFIMVVGLGWAYQAFGGLPWMQAVFYAVGSSVIGIIAFSAYKLTNKSVGRDKWLWGIFVVVGAYTVWTESKEILMFIGAGVLYWFVKSPPNWGRRVHASLTALGSDPISHIASGAASADSRSDMEYCGILR